MFRLVQTDVFASWLAGLRDRRGKARILARLEGARLGHLGDARNLAGGLNELRVHTGPGYRIYFARRGDVVVVLLCGGDKSSQSRDVRRARHLLTVLERDTE